jgi:hypothetical protein
MARMRFAAVLLLLASAVYAQPRFESLQFLIGTWAGEGTGQPGAGQGDFSFQPELNGQVLVRRSFNQLASGPRHEDLMIIYLDGTPRAIYFDSEGHVIHYAMSVPAPNSVVFESNDGPKYRLSYALDGKKLNGKFEVGGKPYLSWTAVKK